MILGLDCADPTLMFDRFRAHMPHVQRLMKQGCWGPLHSSLPPITVPAWMCMVSGRDPGELGLYGFRRRLPSSYELDLVNATDMQAPCLWDYASQAEKRVAVLGVPLTYPPRSVNGIMVSGCLTPDIESDYVWPSSRKRELVERFGPYRIDVADERNGDPTKLYNAICEMTAQRFQMARYLWQTDQPDFLMMVDMGPDRFHHAFWHCFDPDHPAYVPDHPHASWAENYYSLLDQWVGELIAIADKHTAICIVSDHGARAMHGGFCINQWLIDHGLLVLKEPIQSPCALEPSLVDWTRTQVWAEGGYYSRIFINLKDRESHGCVPHTRYADLCSRLTEQLTQLTTPQGKTLYNTIVSPETVYRSVQGHAPDLMAFFDDLRYRAIGSVGQHTWFVHENDRGFDACNHNWKGMFVMAGEGIPALGKQEDLQIYDVTRTVLDVMDIPAPQLLLGRSILRS